MKLWLRQLAARAGVVAASRRFASQRAFFEARLDPRSPVGLRLSLSVLLVIGATWLFGGVAEDVVTGDPLVDVDMAIALWFRAHATPGLTRWMLLVTNAHGTVGISILGVAFALYLLWRKDAYWLLALAAVLPGGVLVNLLLKQVFRRARPSLDDPLLHLATYSFPSGHATAATLFYGVLAAYLAARMPTWRTRLLPLAGAVFLVAVVGLTRVYLGVHYFSDVVAAAAWSSAWIIMWLVAVDALCRRNELQRPPRA
ncbi:MAG: phosphatase PAP2 family protein [Caldimonas sp.]